MFYSCFNCPCACVWKEFAGEKTDALTYKGMKTFTSNQVTKYKPAFLRCHIVGPTVTGTFSFSFSLSGMNLYTSFYYAIQARISIGFGQVSEIDDPSSAEV
jgi:hypothetical protein